MACDMLGAQASGLLGDSRSPPCKKREWLYFREKGVCPLVFFFFHLFLEKKDNDICNYFSNELFALKSLKTNLILELAVVSM